MDTISSLFVWIRKRNIVIIIGRLFLLEWSILLIVFASLPISTNTQILYYWISLMFGPIIFGDFIEIDWFAQIGIEFFMSHVLSLI
jgi:hypothetical protein